MTEATRERMILRKMEPEGSSFAEVAKRVKDTPAMSLLQDNSPSSLLVEGSADGLSEVMAELSGWSAFPVVTYQRPDPRPRILKRSPPQ